MKLRIEGSRLETEDDDRKEKARKTPFRSRDPDCGSPNSNGTPESDLCEVFKNRGPHEERWRGLM